MKSVLTWDQSIGDGQHHSSAFLSFSQMSPLKYFVLTIMTRLKPKQIDLRHTDQGGFPGNPDREFPGISRKILFPKIPGNNFWFPGIFGNFLCTTEGKCPQFYNFSNVFLLVQIKLYCLKRQHPCWKSLKFVNELHFFSKLGCF